MNTLHLRSASILCGMAIASAISGCVTISNNYYPEQSHPATSASTVAYAPPQGQCSCGGYHDARYGYYPPQEGNGTFPRASSSSPAVVYVPQYYPQYHPGYYPPVYAPQPTYRRYPAPTVGEGAGSQSDNTTVADPAPDRQTGVAARPRRSRPDGSQTTDAGRIDITAESTPRRSSNDADRIDVITGDRTTSAEATTSRPRRSVGNDADRVDVPTAGGHSTAAEAPVPPASGRRNVPVSGTDATVIPSDAIPATAAPVGSHERHRTPQANDVSTATNSPVAATERNTAAAPVAATPRKPLPADKADAVETGTAVETQANPAANAGDAATPPVENAPAAARSRRSEQK